MLFCQKQATGESLPPTDDALKFHVMRVNYQLFIWRKKALVAKPTIPPPTGNGCHLEDDILVPTLIEGNQHKILLSNLQPADARKDAVETANARKKISRALKPVYVEQIRIVEIHFQYG